MDVMTDQEALCIEEEANLALSWLNFTISDAVSAAVCALVEREGAAVDPAHVARTTIVAMRVAEEGLVDRLKQSLRRLQRRADPFPREAISQSGLLADAAFVPEKPRPWQINWFG